MEHGDIKVYFQPVVRTLTRAICGLEALTRWQTDKYGLLMPGEYISFLERRRRIHDLDMYVLRKVCENYSREKWRTDVPISINLSRLDYELCDVFESVESEVRANRMPRSSLCIEITESMLASNDALVRNCIERFRNAGYAVWIDDFGSGYSSLNVLKDSAFDELKIDMRFLSDFHARSKKILASIVHMAKEIGVHTLAEGVETEEQFEFLRNIGCEKVQGFLFARPMPFHACLEHVDAAGMTWEPPAMRGYYDDIGNLDVLSASPIHEIDEQDEQITGGDLNSISMAIVELRRDMAKMLYVNDAFEKVATAVEWPLTWRSHPESSHIPLDHISPRIRELLEDTRTGGQAKLLTVYDNDYYGMSGLKLASVGEVCAILINVTNLSQISATLAQQQLDKGLRSLYSMYEQVSLVNLDDLTVVSLRLEDNSNRTMTTGSLMAHIDTFANERVFPDDCERFKRFMSPETLEERTSREGSVSTNLRVMSFHGSYSWKNFQLVRIEPNVYYLLIRNAESEVQELRSTYQTPAPTKGAITPELLWANVVNRYDLKFFWKDRERRFVGASRSFLNHYEFTSQADIVGKTDEDMGWHIHNDPFRDEEWKVLNEGITSRHVEGNCLVQVEDREIVATKMPLFDRDGKIVGLIGSFYQTEAHVSENNAALQARTDDLTGLLNSRGLYENIFAYIDEYQLRSRDFARIEVSIDDFEGINKRYGYDFGAAVIRETGQALLRCCGNTATVGRMSGCVFTVLCQFDDSAELDDLISRIREIPKGLREVNGVPFNMYLSVGTALYSETEDREGMAAQAEMRRMTDDVEGISQRQLMENTGRIFRMFDELPLPYAVYKVFSGPQGDDAIVLYANKAFTEMSQTTLEMLIGARASSFYAVDSNSWITFAVQAGIEGRTVSGKYYYAPLGFEIEIAAYPVIGPGFCAFTFKRVTG